MSEQSQPPLPPRNEFLHNVAIGGAILSPIAMLLPPRKADIRLFVLFSTFSISTNQLVYEYTGHSIYGRVGSRLGSIFDTGLPEGAKRTQQILREQKEREAAQKQRQFDQESKKGGVLNDLWMGGEGEDWKQKRAEEHRKSFEEGKGMSDIIFEQISDVWSGNWGAKAKQSNDAVDNNNNNNNKK